MVVMKNAHSAASPRNGSAIRQHAKSTTRFQIGSGTGRSTWACACIRTIIPQPHLGDGQFDGTHQTRSQPKSYITPFRAKVLDPHVLDREESAKTARDNIPLAGN